MSRCVERVIDTTAGIVGVRAEGMSLTVRWFCGEMRAFNAADLERLIEDIELLAGYPDVWLHACDTSGRRFYAQLEDGELFVNDHAMKVNSVPWKSLKKTLAKMG